MVLDIKERTLWCTPKDGFLRGLGNSGCKKGNHSSQKPSSESGVLSAADPFLEGHCLRIGYGGLRVSDEMGGSFKPYLFFLYFQLFSSKQ